MKGGRREKESAFVVPLAEIVSSRFREKAGRYLRVRFRMFSRFRVSTCASDFRPDLTSVRIKRYPHVGSADGGLMVQKRGGTRASGSVRRCFFARRWDGRLRPRPAARLSDMAVREGVSPCVRQRAPGVKSEGRQAGESARLSSPWRKSFPCVFGKRRSGTRASGSVRRCFFARRWDGRLRLRPAAWLSDFRPDPTSVRINRYPHVGSADGGLMLQKRGGTRASGSAGRPCFTDAGERLPARGLFGRRA